MIAETDRTIVDEVRAAKEANAARYFFDVGKIIEAARSRQEASGRRVIRQYEDPTGKPAARGEPK